MVDSVRSIQSDQKVVVMLVEVDLANVKVDQGEKADLDVDEVEEGEWAVVLEEANVEAGEVLVANESLNATVVVIERRYLQFENEHVIIYIFSTCFFHIYGGLYARAGKLIDKQVISTRMGHYWKSCRNMHCGMLAIMQVNIISLKLKTCQTH